MNQKVWLVEIRLKDWEPSFPGGSRVVCYEEVWAPGEYEARHSGFEQFKSRAGYEPVLRRKLDQYGITPHNCCAPDAVEIDV